MTTARSKRLTWAGTGPRNVLYVPQTRQRLQPIGQDLHVKYREHKKFPKTLGAVITRVALCLADSGCLAKVPEGSSLSCCTRHPYFSPCANEVSVRSRNNPLTNESRCHSRGIPRQRQARRPQGIIIPLAHLALRSGGNHLLSQLERISIPPPPHPPPSASPPPPLLLNLKMAEEQRGRGWVGGGEGGQETEHYRSLSKDEK